MNREHISKFSQSVDHVFHGNKCSPQHYFWQYNDGEVCNVIQSKSSAYIFDWSSSNSWQQKIISRPSNVWQLLQREGERVGGREREGERERERESRFLTAHHHKKTGHSVPFDNCYKYTTPQLAVGPYWNWSAGEMDCHLQHLLHSNRKLVKHTI